MSERRIEMTLKEELDALKARSEARIPEEKRVIMHRATEELEKSGLVDKAPKAGDMAPDFSLKDAEGALVNLRSLLERGPVVLSFFRGGW
jgi:DNA-binding GntR family transcriptional regulator